MKNTTRTGFFFSLVGLLSLSLLICIWAWPSEVPCFRGRSASYWARAIQAAACQDGNGISLYGEKSWATKIRICVGSGHKHDEDLHAVLFGDDPEKIPVLIWLLQHRDSRVRRLAAYGLEKPFWRDFGPVSGSEKALPALIITMKDDVAYVRRQAARTFGQFGPTARDAVPALIQALADEDEQVRSDATYALGKIGPDAREAVPALIELLRSEDHAVRSRSAYALGGIGPAAKDAVPALLKVLNDDSMDARDSAYYALQKNDPDALAEVMRRKDSRIGR
jgi:HEAT repeats